MLELSTRRNILQMKYLGYSDDEISQTLHVSLYDIETHIARASAAEADSVRISAVREAELVKLEQLDEVYLPLALDGSYKAARFVLDVAKRRAALVGADRQVPVLGGPTINLVQILSTLPSAVPPRVLDAAV